MLCSLIVRPVSFPTIPVVLRPVGCWSSEYRCASGPGSLMCHLRPALHLDHQWQSAFCRLDLCILCIERPSQHRCFHMESLGGWTWTCLCLWTRLRYLRSSWLSCASWSSWSSVWSSEFPCRQEMFPLPPLSARLVWASLISWVEVPRRKRVSAVAGTTCSSRQSIAVWFWKIPECSIRSICSMQMLHACPSPGPYGITMNYISLVPLFRVRVVYMWCDTSHSKASVVSKRAKRFPRLRWRNLFPAFRTSFLAPNASCSCRSVKTRRVC